MRMRHIQGQTAPHHADCIHAGIGRHVIRVCGIRYVNFLRVNAVCQAERIGHRGGADGGKTGCGACAAGQRVRAGDVNRGLACDKTGDRKRVFAAFCLRHNFVRIAFHGLLLGGGGVIIDADRPDQRLVRIRDKWLVLCSFQHDRLHRHLTAVHCEHLRDLNFQLCCDGQMENRCTAVQLCCDQIRAGGGCGEADVIIAACIAHIGDVAVLNLCVDGSDFRRVCAGVGILLGKGKLRIARGGRLAAGHVIELPVQRGNAAILIHIGQKVERGLVFLPQQAGLRPCAVVDVDSLAERVGLLENGGERVVQTIQRRVVAGEAVLAVNVCVVLGGGDGGEWFFVAAKLGEQTVTSQEVGHLIIGQIGGIAVVGNRNCTVGALILCAEIDSGIPIRVSTLGIIVGIRCSTIQAIAVDDVDARIFKRTKGVIHKLSVRGDRLRRTNTVFRSIWFWKLHIAIGISNGQFAINCTKQCSQSTFVTKDNATNNSSDPNAGGIAGTIVCTGSGTGNRTACIAAADGCAADASDTANTEVHIAVPILNIDYDVSDGGTFGNIHVG